jgi:hypothetical protein
VDVASSAGEEREGKCEQSNVLTQWQTAQKSPENRDNYCLNFFGGAGCSDMDVEDAKKLKQSRSATEGSEIKEFVTWNPSKTSGKRLRDHQRIETIIA